MKYTIKSHPTRYGGVLFRSRLEARWAAFFDLAGWEWEYEPVDLQHWSPDFKIRTPCYHHENGGPPGCGNNHAFLCEVKPYSEVVQFFDHPMFLYWERYYKAMKTLGTDGMAAFGLNPSVGAMLLYDPAGHDDDTPLPIVGHECCVIISEFMPDSCELWKQAGNMTQFMPPTVETTF